VRTARIRDEKTLARPARAPVENAATDARSRDDARSG